MQRDWSLNCNKIRIDEYFVLKWAYTQFDLRKQTHPTAYKDYAVSSRGKWANIGAL